jgi:hypothetical protein
MSVTSSAGWNALLMTCTVVSAAALLTDWLLSPKAKAALKDRIAAWWLRVDEFRWTGLLAEDARSSLDYLVRVFGDRPLSVRFIGLSMGGSLLLMLALLLLARSHFNPVDDAFRWVVATLLPIGAIAAWLSLLVTVNFLRMMRSASRLWAWLALALMNAAAIFIIYFMAALPMAVVIETVADIPTDMDYIAGRGEVLSPAQEDRLARVEPTQDFIAVSAELLFLNTLCPSLPYIVLAIFLVLAKALRPILQPATALILARVYEDQRSALTLFGLAVAGIGVIAKALQELLK